MINRVIFDDNLNALRKLPDGSVDLIYIDPPFNTGKVQARTQIRTSRAEGGDRIGFGSQSYSTEGRKEDYRDAFDDFLSFWTPPGRSAAVLKQMAASTFTSIIEKCITAK